MTSFNCYLPSKGPRSGLLVSDWLINLAVVHWLVRVVCHFISRFCKLEAWKSLVETRRQPERVDQKWHFQAFFPIKYTIMDPVCEYLNSRDMHGALLICGIATVIM